MTENHKTYLLGRAKLVIAREFEDQEWTVVTNRLWSDHFDYDSNYGGNEDYMNDVLHMSDLQEDYTAEVAKLTGSEKSVGVFELVCEVHGESWKSWTDYGYEYNAREWLENVKVNELKGEILEWFKEEQQPAWIEYFGEEAEDAGNG